MYTTKYCGRHYCVLFIELLALGTRIALIRIQLMSPHIRSLILKENKTLSKKYGNIYRNFMILSNLCSFLPNFLKIGVTFLA